MFPNVVVGHTRRHPRRLFDLAVRKLPGKKRYVSNPHQVAVQARQDVRVHRALRELVTS